ncbi:MAG: hypothetical protein HUJ56_13535 [Erysipelotrichaceae bacterium]|nr:hypothetical protein [Erysipelotrichaceae bacterium]
MKKEIEAEQVFDEIDDVGVHLYNSFGNILVVCGLVSFGLMLFVSRLPQDYEKYNIPMFFRIWSIISIVVIVIGILPIVLGKTSKTYRDWVNKDAIKWALEDLKKM